LAGQIQLHSVEALEDLALALASFASDCAEAVESGAADIERRGGLLEDRCRELARRVEYWQEEYDRADEDDDLDHIARRLHKAEEDYERARSWLGRVEDTAADYARAASRARELTGQTVPDACAFLRQKVSEVREYLAEQFGPAGYAQAKAAEFATALSSNASSVVTARAAAAALGPNGEAPAYDARALRSVIGEECYDELAGWVEAAKSRDESLCDVLTSELVAVRHYTSEGYHVNEALRAQDALGLHKYAPFIAAAKAGLNKLPEYAGTVYRGTWLKEELLTTYRVGEVVVEPAFTSTSASPHSSYSGNAQFFINSRHGRDVSQVAWSSNEREVIFPPGTKFKVAHVKRGAGGMTKIFMSEL
jgi:hypothetical protein